MIDIDGLVFDYPGHRALHGVQAHIEAKTATALVGPNGAGKSTLLRCIAGLDEPLDGRIQLAGIDVLEHPREVHKKLGYLSDFFGLYQQLTVRQCLHYAAASQGLSKSNIEKRVQTVVQQLGLQEKIDVLSSRLSRGQRQRVAIGQAIVHAPQVLLLDEPASGLDPEARSHLAGLFRQLHASGMTLVVSSHILSELDEYCTHILSIRNGKITGHKRLQGTMSDAAYSPITMGIRTADAEPQLAKLLAPYRVLHLDTTGQGLTKVALHANDMVTRAELLAMLIRHGVSVSEYKVVRTSLQESYSSLLYDSKV